MSVVFLFLFFRRQRYEQIIKQIQIDMQLSIFFLKNNKPLRNNSYLCACIVLVDVLEKTDSASAHLLENGVVWRVDSRCF